MKHNPLIGNRFVPLLLLAALLLPALTAHADTPAAADTLGENAVPQKTVRDVLVLFPYAPDYPAWGLFLNGLKQGFAYEKTHSIRYQYEFLNMNLASEDPGYLGTTADYLRYKYQLRTPDVVVASTMLESFIAIYGERTFPDVPIIMASTEVSMQEQTGNPHVYTLLGPFDVLKTVELALTLRPDTRRFYVVLGSTPQELSAGIELRRLASTLTDKAEFIFLEGLFHKDLLSRISGVERDSAVIFCWYLSDPSGVEYRPATVVKEIADISPVPVFGIEQQYLGSGIVGGYLWSMATYGKNVAVNALGILDGPESGIPRFSRIETSTYGLDWNALKHWDMNPGLIPGNASVINNEHSFLEIYGVYVLIFALLIAALIIMGVVLVLYALGKRQIERELDVVSLRLSLALKEGAELNRRLDSRALRDPHTGLFIRKHVDERIEDEFLRYEKTGAEFSLIQVDVDSFATVNDRFGRETGNILLSRIAGELIKLVRLYDVLARWSGEEFMILLPDTDEDTAVAFAERIRKAVSGAVYFEQEHKLVVTISCGVAASGDALSVADLIRNVGAALTGAQRNGRNRVVRFSSVSSV